ncbi:MAG: biotin/lipoyl-containing protein, partial [Candidatus Binatus sp.]
MSNEITMPKLSDTMEEGKILRWLKHPGDKIARGEAIAEVETDKADMVLESFDEGVLEQIKLNEGESAPVGTVIALMKSAGAKDAKSGAKPGSQGDTAAVTERASQSAKPIATKPKAAEKKESPKRSIAPAAVVTDGSAGDLHVHPAMSANLSAAPTAIAAPPPQP